MTKLNNSYDLKLLEALEWFDNDTRLKRIERIKWVGEYQISAVIVGKVEVMSLLEEARDSYVQGHFIASLMLATATIEHFIVEELVYANKCRHNITFTESIQYARDEELFPTELLTTADKLRELRNSYAHLKPPNHIHLLGSRYVSQERHPEALKENDAKEAIIAMYAFLKHALH